MSDFNSYINLPFFDQNGRLNICVDRDTILTDFINEQDEQARERLKRRYQAILEFARPRALPVDGYEARFDDLAALLDGIAVSPYQKPLPEPSADRTLLEILADVLKNQLFSVLGPESQQPGPVIGDCRFVCIFCHEVKKRTGDIRTHLNKKHGCTGEEIKTVFNKKDPQWIRVFGQYSYDDVLANKWRITDWRHRKPRSLHPVDVTSQVSASSKRKSRDSSQESVAYQRTPMAWTSPYNHERALSSENLRPIFPLTDDNDLTFVGTTLSPTSPFPQTMADLHNDYVPPQIRVDSVSGTDAVLPSLESSITSDVDLVQIGASAASFSLSSGFLSSELALSPSLPDHAGLEDAVSPLALASASIRRKVRKNCPTEVALPRSAEHYRRH